MNAKKPYRLVSTVLLISFAVIFLLPFAAAPSGKVFRCAVFGWWHFLQRNLPQLSYDWGLIATGLICSALAIVVGNGLLRASCNQLQQSRYPDRPLRRWRWRWTFCLYASVWLFFMIAFGASGVLRHTTWLMNYGEPWYHERMSPYVELRSLDVDIRTLALDVDGDLQATRKAFCSQPWYRHQQTLVTDQFDVIFYGDQSNKVAAYLMIPRQGYLRGAGKFGASMPGSTDVVRPMSDLGSTIAALDAAYPEHTSLRRTE